MSEVDTRVVDTRPSYRLTRLLPLDSSSRNLNQSAVSESLIEVPNAVAWRPDMCSLDFQLNVPAQGAGRYTYIHQMHSCISRLVIESRNGTRLCDLPFCAEYLKTITPVATHHTALQDKDYNWNFKGKGSSVFKSNKLAFPIPFAESNSARVTCTNLSNAEAERPDMSITDFQYVTCELGAGQPTPENNAVVLNYSIPFKEFQHCFASEADTVYFPQSLNVRITWNSIDNLGFTTTANDYATGLAALNTTAGAISVSNIRMYLAVQTNQNVNDGLIAQTNAAGWIKKLDYVHSYLQTTGNVRNASVQTRLNRGQGERLKAILTTYMHTNTDNPACVYDRSNVDERMVSTIYSQLNSKNLQEIILDCSNYEDFEFLRPLLKGSVIGQSSDTFKYNNVWIDQWSNTPLCDDDGSVEEGLDLSTEVLYTVTTTHPQFGDPTLADVAYRVFTFAICRRSLMVSPTGDIQVI